MFCPKCGNQIADGVAFCPSCGNKMMQAKTAPDQRQYQPTNQYQQAQPNRYQQQPQRSPYQQQAQRNPYQQAQPNQYQQAQHTSYQNQGYSPAAKKASKSKLPMIIGIAAAAAVALILIFVVLKPFGGNTNTPEGTIKKLETAFNDLDLDAMLDCFDISAREQIGDLSEYTSYIQMAKSFITIEVHMSGSNFNYYTEDGKEYCTCDLSMSGKISAMGQEQSMSETDNVTLVKENGQWLFSTGGIDDFLGNIF